MKAIDLHKLAVKTLKFDVFVMCVHGRMQSAVPIMYNQ